MLRREHLVVESRLDALFRVQRWFKDVLASVEPDALWVQAYCDRLIIALAEGFTNAVRHAHRALPPETPIAIDLLLGPDRIDIHIWDYGQPFDPNQLGEPEPCLPDRSG